MFDLAALSAYADQSEEQNPENDPLNTEPKEKYPWSAQQLAIFDEFKNRNSGNLIIIARAGSAKTSSAIEGGRHAPEREIIYAAFGKRIAKELSARIFDDRCSAQTIHSMGARLIREHRKIDVTPDIRYIRANRAITEYFAVNHQDSEAEKYITDESWIVVKLVEYVKGMAPYAGSIDEVIDVSDKMNITRIPPDRKKKWPKNLKPIIEVVAEIVIINLHNVMEEALIKTGRVLPIDFNDMIWLPVICGWLKPIYSLVVIDEVQDLNVTQLEIAAGICNGRVVLIGDPMQAIYAWRGADSNGMARMTELLNCKELYLTTSFRCPKSVVKLAQRYCPDFEAWDKAIEGEVKNISYDKMFDIVQDGDFVISRTNAPLMGICLRLIAQGRRAMMAGNDIGLKLLKIVEKLEKDVPFQNARDMWGRLLLWAKAEKDKAAEDVAKKFAKAKQKRIDEEIKIRQSLVDDEIGMFRHMLGQLETPQKVKDQLRRLFERDDKEDLDRSHYTLCSSVHKIKGLEAENVFVLADTLRTKNQEERNIAYVATTRSKNRLYMCYAHEEQLAQVEEERKMCVEYCYDDEDEEDDVA